MQVIGLPSSGNGHISLTVLCNGTTLQQTSSAKYLGVHTDEHLNWTEHVQHVIHKVSARLASLWTARNLIPTCIAKRLYQALIVPDILYCSKAYYAGVSAGCKEKLLKLMKRCVRCVGNAQGLAHTAPIMVKLGVNSIDVSAARKLAVLMFRVKTKPISPVISRRVDPVTNSSTRGGLSHSYRVPKVTRSSGKRRPLFHGVVLWNSLSSAAREAPTLSLFKERRLGSVQRTLKRRDQRQTTCGLVNGSTPDFLLPQVQCQHFIQEGTPIATINIKMVMGKAASKRMERAT